MATRRYKINVSETELQIVEEAGAATNSKGIELTVDLATTLVNDANPAGSAITRGIRKEELIRALGTLIDYITKGNWPPA